MHQLSVWERESFFQDQDIIIVGAGLLGLWTAYEIKQRKPSCKITLIEKETFPNGASTRNAGFLCFGSPSELLYDVEKMGLENMLGIVENRIKGIHKIKQLFATATIDIDECGGYEGFSDDFDDAQLDWLNEQIQPITKLSATYKKVADQTAIGVKNFGCLVASATEAAIHSGKLVQALIQKNLSAGVQILFGCKALIAQDIGKGTLINTNYGYLKTQQLIYCTNGFSRQLTGADINPARGQVFVTSIIPNLPLKGTFHFDEGYYYWRNLNNRILIGGARNEDFIGELTTKMETTPKIMGALRNFIQQYIIIPQNFTIDYEWSGIMGFTDTKQPLLWEKDPCTWVACACNGMGVALSPVFAEKIADKVLQKL